MKQLTGILIGAGGRGMTYTRNMMKEKDKFAIVAVADPNPLRVELACEVAGIASENCYTDWREILAKPKMADFAIIATQDKDHYAPAMRAIELGYDLLLEKPIAPTPEECISIAKAAHEHGVKVLVCHVLRFTPFFKALKLILDDGVIGDIMSLVHVEAVGNIHQSHSFVRGPWHDEKESTPMLLAKCCHDLDIIQWLIGKPCKKVTSFGELSYFTEANAPVGAPARCTDGGCPVADTCPYNSERIYGDTKDWYRGHSSRKRCKGAPDDETVARILREDDFGRCVFRMNNDVVDHQVVNMQFEGGVTAQLNMNAFNKGGRFIRIFGTKGELTAYMNRTDIEVYTFEDRQTHIYDVTKTSESITGGHGGGDSGIVHDLYDYFCDTYGGFSIADINVSAANHLIGYAAEQARHTDTVVSLDGYFTEHAFENKYF